MSKCRVGHEMEGLFKGEPQGLGGGARCVYGDEARDCTVVAMEPGPLNPAVEKVGEAFMKTWRGHVLRESKACHKTKSLGNAKRTQPSPAQRRRMKPGGAK